MRIRKSTLKRIIAEAASGLQMARLEDAVRGQDIEISMGGYGPVLIRNGQMMDMSSTGLDYALESLWEDLGPEEAYEWIASRARSVGIDPDTAEDLGLE